ncbi:MAG: hypothetical protein FVQ81_13295 [Candidatus Glassbacteria bacterium]|nr:hypothetical protein [Candidatus Glassbacteria bacterium]
MIAAVETYLSGKLVAAGIPAKRIAQLAKDSRTRQMPFAELFDPQENFQRDGSKASRDYDGATQQATNAVRLYNRELALTVKIVHRSKAQLDTLFTSFLASVERGFTDPLPAPATGDQFIRIIPGTATWADDPALLKDRAEVEMRFLFRGGVYQETTAGTTQQVNMPAVPNFT